MNANEHRIGFDCTCDLPMSADIGLLALDGKDDCKLDAMQSMTPEEVELALATIGEAQ